MKRTSKARKNSKDAPPPVAKWEAFPVVGGREGDPAWMVHYDQDMEKFVAKKASTTLHLHPVRYTDEGNFQFEGENARSSNPVTMVLAIFKKKEEFLKIFQDCPGEIDSSSEESDCAASQKLVSKENAAAVLGANISSSSAIENSQMEKDFAGKVQGNQKTELNVGKKGDFGEISRPNPAVKKLIEVRLNYFTNNG